MSQADQDHAYMTAKRAVSALETQLAAITVRLKEIGRGFGQWSQDLLEDPPYFNVDRAIVEAEVSKVWDLLERYKAASAELEKRQADLKSFRVDA